MITLIDKLALYFHKQEFDKGDVAGLLMTNRPDYIAVVLAFSKLGSITGLLNTHLKHKMLLTRIKKFKCKVVVISNDLLPGKCN